MTKLKLSFVERKALLQLSVNEMLSPVALRSKRVTAMLVRLRDKGLITYDPDEDPFCAFVTDEGRAALEH